MKRSKLTRRLATLIPSNFQLNSEFECVRKGDPNSAVRPSSSIALFFSTALMSGATFASTDWLSGVNFEPIEMKSCEAVSESFAVNHVSPYVTWESSLERKSTEPAVKKLLSAVEKSERNFIKGKITKAVQQVEKALARARKYQDRGYRSFAFDSALRVARDVLSDLKARRAVYYAQTGKFDLATAELKQFYSPVLNDVYDEAWWVVLNLQHRYIEGHSTSESPDYNASSAILHEHMQTLSSTTYGRPLAKPFQCLYSSVLEIAGERSFKANLLEEALGMVVAAESLVPDAPRSNGLHTILLIGLGHQSLREGDPTSAFNFLRSAYDRHLEGEELRALASMAFQETGRQLLLDQWTVTVRDALEFAVKLDPNNESAQNLLTDAYVEEGRAAYLSGNSGEAASAFERALSRRPEQDNVKRLFSYAISDVALHAAASGNFEDAYDQLYRARETFAFEGIEEYYADIALLEGQAALQNGIYWKAEKVLLAASKREGLKATTVATQLYQDLDAAVIRSYRLSQAMQHWKGIAPQITGSQCDAGTRKVDCSKIVYFNRHRPVGWSDPEAHVIYFDSDVVMSDLDRDGIYDTVQKPSAGAYTIYREADQDGLIDMSLTVAADGTVTDTTYYSGTVMVRIPSGAVAVSTDWFSNPDAYLALLLNDRYIGSTAVDPQTAFPTWDEAFVVTMKYGDSLTVQMIDANIIQDRLIDKYEFDNLPKAGIWTGQRRHALIELRSTPTSRSPGVYAVETANRVNTFEFANFDQHLPHIQELVRDARSLQKQGDQSAVLASWIVPEILTMTIFGSQSIGAQFFIGLAGQEVVENLLRNRR